MTAKIQKKIDISEDFLIEMTTQSPDKTLLIEQNSNKFEVTIRSSDGKYTPVPRYMLQGIPKINRIPEEFFTQSIASVSESSVRFSARVKGGGFGRFNRGVTPAETQSSHPILSVHKQDKAGSKPSISACAPGTAQDHSFSTTKKENMKKQVMYKGSGVGHDESKETTRYWRDCLDPECASSGANPNNKPG